MKSVVCALLASSSMALFACSSSSSGNFGGSGSDQGSGGDGSTSNAGSGDSGSQTGNQMSANDSGAAGCTQGDLSGVVGASCANCLATSCASMLQACTTTCSGCAASLLGCSSCASACGVPEDSGATEDSHTSPTAVPDSSSAAPADGGGAPCAKLISCNGCTFVGASMPTMQAPCMAAAMGTSAPTCQGYLAAVQAAGYCK